MSEETKELVATLRRKVDKLQKIRDNYYYHRATAYPSEDNNISTLDCLLDLMDTIQGMQSLIYEIESRI